jgi:hypothetical protein
MIAVLLYKWLQNRGKQAGTLHCTVDSHDGAPGVAIVGQPVRVHRIMPIGIEDEIDVKDGCSTG